MGGPINGTARRLLSLGAGGGALAVALGAFGAHGLKEILCEEMLNIYHTGVEYHFYHSLALLAAGLFALYRHSRVLAAAGWSFALGILLFSGSLYALSITGIRWLGAITPLGGLLLITGWLLLAVAFLKNK